MVVLIIGLGSIAKKHIDAIKEIDDKPVIYALRSNKNVGSYQDVINVFSLKEIYNLKLDFCIISNPTSKHYETIKKIISLKNIPLFIEKPSLMDLWGAKELAVEIENKKIITYVAHNLRFHPALRFINSFLPGKRVIEANIYCGSYLPSWRPGIDYKKNYSAIASLGGGVHLDLIHELDYAIWLFGYPNKSFAFRRKISNLNIDSTDFAVYHFFYEDKIINITLNYYRKDPKREIEIVMENETIKVDLLKSIIINDKSKVLYKNDITGMYTYIAQMKYFYNVINGNSVSFSTLKDSLKVLEICLQNNY